ncbi:MAG: DNA polymerase III subunit gamma/tau [Bryobacteraceae bacterium]
MYQVIARKYRPRNFKELIGQEHVRTTIENAIAQRRIAHGYIFSGQRGTGKTTVARILARCLNCIEGPTTTPCGVCASCLEISAGNAVDVIEIDAASNRGINEMRELRENVRYQPARDRYKVFIVDEAHQITNEAFNALLKTLEEPPEWVVFVLCTTESHKIPSTIASRCQQFSFRSVDFAEIVGRMEWICREEGIQAEPETLGVLAQSGEGSVRDSLSALDQAIACCGTTLKAAEVRTLLGMFSLDSLGAVAEALLKADSAAMLELVADLERNGRSLQHFCRELARYFRNLLVARIAGPNTLLIAAPANEQERLGAVAQKFSEDDLTRYLQLTLDLFKELQYAPQTRLHLELGLLRLVHAGRLLPIEDALASLGDAGGGLTPSPRTEAAAAAKRNIPAGRATSPGATQPVSSAPASGDLRSRLQAALLAAGRKFTADAVAHSEVSESGSEVMFLSPKKFSLSMNAADLQKAAVEVAGRPMRVTVKFDEPSAGDARASATAPPDAESEVSRRALAHPEVQEFQQKFPESRVRAVRDLKQ